MESSLITVLIIVLIAGAIWWAIDLLGITDPFNRIAKLIVLIVAILKVIHLFF
jgi:hypothetical protein